MALLDRHARSMFADLNATSIDVNREWLEADGLGGFASGTSSGVATRRYHALLLAAQDPPSNRVVLVNGFRAWLETPSGNVQLTRHYFAPDVLTAADARLESFTTEPWPTWRYVGESGLVIEQELFVERGSPSVYVRFQAFGAAAGVRLCLRPFFSGRDFHAMHHENPVFRWQPGTRGRALCFSPYDGVPSTELVSNGEYQHAPEWYRSFRYQAELARGLESDEDLAAPGVLRFDLSEAPAILILHATTPGSALGDADATTLFARASERERARRAAFPSVLARAADSYLVSRGRGRTVIAGYPWFGDWGRDTFIALRGLCLATGRFAEAREILLEWSNVVSDGMLPNRFPDGTGEPEYNSVDASLWYVIAVSELLEADSTVPDAERRALQHAVLAIVEGYGRGTRYGIARDADGLLRAGVPGVQLTWMDAKVGDYVVTPRIGKPVEIQALWINALAIAARFDPRYGNWSERARASFEARFWNESGGYLYDVVDVHHEPTRVDRALRPNQIFAAGGLPLTLVSAERARRIVDRVATELVTPLGLRTLGPQEPGYVPHFRGGIWERDTAYHQGTAWPWLMGPFVEAWLKSRSGNESAKREAEQRFVEPLRQHLAHAGIGHVSEVADGDPPFTPGGCPFQAWSVGELLRVERLLQRKAE